MSGDSNENSIFEQATQAKRLLAATGVLGLVTMVSSFCMATQAITSIPKAVPKAVGMTLAGVATIRARKKSSEAIAALQPDYDNPKQAELIEYLQVQDHPYKIPKSFTIGGVASGPVVALAAKYVMNSRDVICISAVSPLIAMMTVKGGIELLSEYQQLSDIQKLSAVNRQAVTSLPDTPAL